MKKSTQEIVRRTCGRGTLIGGEGADQIWGGAGNDNIYGDARLRWRERAAIINCGNAANDDAAHAWRASA